MIVASEIERYQKRLRRQLTETEITAISWARQNYGHNWRRRFGTSLEQHMRERPVWATKEVWSDWYTCPFTSAELNALVQTMYRLVAEGL